MPGWRRGQRRGEKEREEQQEVGSQQDRREEVVVVTVVHTGVGGNRVGFGGGPMWGGGYHEAGGVEGGSIGSKRAWRRNSTRRGEGEGAWGMFGGGFGRDGG
jgi:hypothetical protein